MPFNLDQLFDFCTVEIERFAAVHQEEIFYVFAIDASLLCLNSEQAFAEILKNAQEEWDLSHRPIAQWEDLTKKDLSWESYILDLSERFDGLDRSDRTACLQVINESRARRREEGNPYRKKEGIEELRSNTGDWAYQGFADMANCDGFDQSAYSEHYDMPDEEQKTSAYGTAMDQLVERLRDSGVFAKLNTTPAFYATRVEHNY